MFWIFASVVLLCIVFSPGFRLFTFFAVILAGIAFGGMLAYSHFITEPRRAEQRRQDAMMEANAKLRRQQQAEQDRIKIANDKKAAKFQEDVLNRSKKLWMESTQKALLKISEDSFKNEKLSLHNVALGYHTYPGEGGIDFGQLHTRAKVIFPFGLHKRLDVYRSKGFFVTGRVRNESKELTLVKFGLGIVISDCSVGGCEVIGDIEHHYDLEVPPEQSRDLNHQVHFNNDLRFSGMPSTKFEVITTFAKIDNIMMEEVNDLAKQLYANSLDYQEGSEMLLQSNN